MYPTSLRTAVITATPLTEGSDVPGWKLWPFHAIALILTETFQGR